MTITVYKFNAISLIQTTNFKIISPNTYWPPIREVASYSYTIILFHFHLFRRMTCGQWIRPAMPVRMLVQWRTSWSTPTPLEMLVVTLFGVIIMVYVALQTTQEDGEGGGDEEADTHPSREGESSTSQQTEAQVWLGVKLEIQQWPQSVRRISLFMGKTSGVDSR